jgi:hypothetical protein
VWDFGWEISRRRFPSTRSCSPYRGLHVRLESLGLSFKDHFRSPRDQIPHVTIRNFCIASPPPAVNAPCGGYVSSERTTSALIAGGCRASTCPSCAGRWRGCPAACPGLPRRRTAWCAASAPARSPAPRAYPTISRRTAMYKLRIVTGWGDRKWSLNEGQLPNSLTFAADGYM